MVEFFNFIPLVISSFVDYLFSLPLNIIPGYTGETLGSFLFGVMFIGLVITAFVVSFKIIDK